MNYSLNKNMFLNYIILFLIFNLKNFNSNFINIVGNNFNNAKGIKK